MSVGIIVVVLVLVGGLALVGVIAAVVTAGLGARRRLAEGRADPMLLFSEAEAFPGPQARRWAYGVLYEAGVDADADPRYAAEVLCDAEPGLRPADAQTLIRVMGGAL